MQEFKGRAGVITGAGNGIGRACARLFAAHGMKVVVSDVNGAEAEAVVEQIRSAGGEATAVACDVSNRAQVQALAERATQAYGTIDLVFANAGVTSFRQLIDTSTAEWDHLTGVDYDGVAQCIRAFLPGMVERGRGHVVATSSVAGLIPTLAPNHVPYSAAKSAVIGLIANLKLEVVQKGVACSVVCPGKVTTDILSRSQNLLKDHPGDEWPMPVATQVALDMSTRTTEQAAEAILDGIQKDALFIFTDPSPREAFLSYVDEVLAGFDGAAEFDRTHQFADAGGWPWK